MMNFRLRLFQDNIIDVVNTFDDLPYEGKRLVLESIMHLLEKKADEAIVKEREAFYAESIPENKLGELSE